MMRDLRIRTRGERVRGGNARSHTKAESREGARKTRRHTERGARKAFNLHQLVDVRGESKGLSFGGHGRGQASLEGYGLWVFWPA